MAIPGLFFRLYLCFQTNIPILQQKMWKKFYIIYSAGIRTHDLQNMSLSFRPEAFKL